MAGLICWLSRELSPGKGSRGEKMVAIFTLFCIVFIDSRNKCKILNKISWKLQKKKKKKEVVVVGGLERWLSG
jgi:hypothetical protein